jgi:two-component system, chemotaxis family, response regulator Rcp1
MFASSGAILLVEDDEAYFELFKIMVNDHLPGTAIARAKNAHELDHILNKQGFKPTLILLDLNIPGKNGKEILRDLKNDPSCAGIPVIVLTTSANPDDKKYAEDMGANFKNKPIDLTEYIEFIKSLEFFLIG